MEKIEVGGREVVYKTSYSNKAARLSQETS